MEKVRISRYFGSPETDLHIAENAWCIDYTDTWLSKWVDWLSKSPSTNLCTTYYGCESTVEFDIGVAWASLPIPRIHPHMSQESKIQWLPATLHNAGWMDHGQIHHGNFEVTQILGPVDVEKAYCYSASPRRCLQWHVRSYGQCYASFSWEED